MQDSTLGYADLLKRGISTLQQIGVIWTDVNAHDPGITILEQVCYALTDLSYRIGYPLADLLAASASSQGNTLFPPEQILPNAPVTALDWRKLAADVEGVRNAWIEPTLKPDPQPHYDPLNHTISLHPASFHDEPLQLRGLHRILIDTPDHTDVAANSRTAERVWERLHASRALCEDFVQLQPEPPQDVAVQLKLEIGRVENANALLLTILQRLSEYIEPGVRFYTLQERLDAGLHIDEIYNGPLLEHGFVDDDELAASSRRDAIRGSDLIQLLMDIDGVRAVRSLKMSSGTATAEWFLQLDERRVARLKPPSVGVTGSATQIQLLRHGLPVVVDIKSVIEDYERWRHNSADHKHDNPGTWPQPQGRNRNPGHYDSIQYQFPALYALGENRLPGSASAEHQAQVDQLKAYLLLFDQILANQFAQVGRVGELFSTDPPSTQSYFSKLVDDPDLDVNHLLQLNADELQQLTEASGMARQHRFLNHLLARFGEQLLDYALVLNQSDAPRSRWEQVSLYDKRRLLGTIPEISSRRGAGFNYLQPISASNQSGLLQRLRLKLGLTRQPQGSIALVEHILLRPIAEDAKQTTPLLEGVNGDPYSLQATLVLASGLHPAGDDAVVNEFVAHTVREETPAHLNIAIRWLDSNKMSQFVEAQKRWQRAFDRYYGPFGTSDPDAHFRLRAARDQVIDLISDCNSGLGQTNPIVDLPVHWPQPSVPYDEQGDITIEYSQPDVLYRLERRDSSGQPILISEGIGNGRSLTLKTDSITEDATFDIYAQKVDDRCSQRRTVALQQRVTVRVGLNLGLTAEIVGLPFLEGNSAVRQPSDARICDYNMTYQVRLPITQEGIIYQLKLVGGWRPISLSSPSHLATGGELTLTALAPVKEDIDIRIRATRPSTGESDLLQVALPLRVRANPNVTVTPQGQVIAYNDSAAVELNNPQSTVTYQLYRRNIPDRDMARAVATGNDYLNVTVLDQWHPLNTPDYRRIENGNIYVRKPKRPHPWQGRAGLTPLGQPKAGQSGNPMQLDIDSLQEDSVVIVKAEKQHRVSADPNDLRTVTSAVQLEQAAAILVAPNPAHPIKVHNLENIDRVTVSVTNGELGVLYYIVDNPTRVPLGRPAFFFKHGESGLLKGIGAMGVEIDLVVGKETEWQSSSKPRTISLKPPPTSGNQIVSMGIDVIAVKAMTGVAVRMKSTMFFPFTRQNTTLGNP